jgi:hypothetical protein
MTGYPAFLKYFMWKEQVHFMLSCKAATESLFEKIDSQLLATTFLIGFQVNGKGGGQSICFEPEKMEFLRADLDHIDKLVTYHDSEDPQPKINNEESGQQELVIKSKKSKIYREALIKALDGFSLFKDKIHFVAEGVERDGYKVFLVLQLKRSVYLKYQYLRYVDPDEDNHKHLSFIDALVDVYLEDRVFRLYLPNAGPDPGPNRTSDELLRAAATNFLYSVAFVGRSGSLHAIPPACEILSLFKYESKENAGHLIICRIGHPALDFTLKLASDFPITEHRKIRKLLELTNDEIGVVTNGKMVLGLGKRRESYDTSKEDFFDILFKGLHCYDVMHSGQPLLLMRNGCPEQIRRLIDFDNFSKGSKEIFKNISDDRIGILYSLSLAATQSKKGCILVFINDAREEAKRLEKQGIPIIPKKLDNETVKVLATIDGALLIDLNGYAHATGVILDGIAGFEGDASRGSRYNSALTYHQSRGSSNPTLIVVVSEDGMVDIIPKFIPKIWRSEIEQFIKTLESLNSLASFNDGTFYNTMGLLKKREFYLTNADCDKINKLKLSLQEMDKQTKKHSWMTFDDFKPNPKMNSTYYNEEKN